MSKRSTLIPRDGMYWNLKIDHLFKVSFSLPVKIQIELDHILRETQFRSLKMRLKDEITIRWILRDGGIIE